MTPASAVLLMASIFTPPQRAPEKIPVGKETTYVTGPLDKDGHVDYPAAFVERLGKGITPERNANVLLWKAIGPMPDSTVVPAEFFKRLGIPQPSKEGDYFVKLGAHLKQSTKLTQEEIDAIYSDLLNAPRHPVVRRPWTAKDHPQFAEWLKINEKPLALVVEATKRPCYFSPPDCGPPESPKPLIESPLWGLNECREFSAALTARALLRAGEGDLDGTRNDLLACYRLGRLIGRGGFLTHTIIGCEIESFAHFAEVGFLAHTTLTYEQLRAHLKNLQALPAPMSTADVVEFSERVLHLDGLQNVLRMYREAGRNWDWGPAFRDANRWYDRLARVMRNPDRAAGEKELDDVQQDVNKLWQEATGWDKKEPKPTSQKVLDALAEGQPHKWVGEVAGAVLVGEMIAGLRKGYNTRCRTDQFERNLHVALALEAYNRDQKSYPAKLDDLAPKYLAKIPRDHFSGKPLIYRPSEKGYLLYSVGVNGKDEGGRWLHDDPSGDDLCIRMPAPEAKPMKK